MASSKPFVIRLLVYRGQEPEMCKIVRQRVIWGGGEGLRKWAPLLQMSHHLDFRTSAVVPATHPPAAVATPYNPSSNLELLYNTGALTKSSNLIE